MITLETIQQKQAELAALIQQLTSHTTHLIFPKFEVELRHGERYAGTVLSEDGQIQHHLVLMARRPATKLTWAAAMEWAESVDGSLPTRQEQALLYANCKPHLDPCWHWSCESHKEDASCAWYCYFGYGYQSYGHKSYEGSAVAVRRFI
ncbi:DUF1566 domain-containing protein [Hydrogenophaga sp.]|uniref:DUF1566 domain-containing protein n=1 Tax=Hydrogenophaga sp. TaxID=1904254 RepID=UPI0027293B01|nr:DUF1566 domain-containing protein [Hydrogenophaga sp.]MDO8902936.1 DUF1566 domain-containing protein [Hydrogenophaga sp.]